MTNPNESRNFRPAAEQSGFSPKSDLFVPGQVLVGKYEVMALIGTGGMGKVYKVRQVFLNKSLALKVLDLNQALSDIQLRRFQLEAKAAFSLSHPNLVKVFDFGMLESQEPYLVMDFVDGITLHDYVKKNGPISPEQAVRIFSQACSGLAYAHQRSVVHRDIKPSNIMLDAGARLGANNSVKIVDFGIAKLAESGDVQGLTKTGEIFGSPLYMSPEQCSGDVVDHRSDIYSLGCTLFEALTGTPPHVGHSALRTMMLHQTSPAPLMREASLGKSFPSGLEHIVQTMLKKAPAERYQNLDEVIEELKTAMTDGKVLSVESATNITPVAATKSGVVSLTPLRLVVLIAAIILASSLGSIFVYKLVFSNSTGDKIVGMDTTNGAASSGMQDRNSKLPSVRITKKKHEPRDMSKPRDLSLEAAGAGDFFTRRLQKTRTAFDRVQDIKSEKFVENGVTLEKIVFPSTPIGTVSNFSFARVLRMNTPKFVKAAMSTVAFEPTDFLRLSTGGAVVEALKVPSIFEKIDRGLFDELDITASQFDLVVADTFSKEQQDDNVVQILNTASTWSKLSGLSLTDLSVHHRTLEAIGKIKKLGYLKLDNSSVDSNDLAKQPFLKQLNFLALTHCPNERIVRALDHSKSLQSLCLNDAPLSLESVDTLATCTNLTFLDLRLPPVSDAFVKALPRLKHLEILEIHETEISEAQLKQILASCPNLHRIDLGGQSKNHVGAELASDKRVRLLQDRSIVGMEKPF